ncbi:hypothetical protein RHS01_06557 [Rhizoctonia solani]|uniref:Uncharacterized protein n=1 Tax=Rhizoctonia solani TaxID=456999 RepID=A0A8H7M0L7_9AGAM|nr:hypothetical protein RHS01_06557 [Rhizoctonia solani]
MGRDCGTTLSYLTSYAQSRFLNGTRELAPRDLILLANLPSTWATLAQFPKDDFKKALVGITTNSGRSYEVKIDRAVGLDLLAHLTQGPPPTAELPLQDALLVCPPASPSDSRLTNEAICYAQPTSSYRERSLVTAIRRQKIRRQSCSPATFIDARQNTTTSQRKQVREFESNGFQLKISARTSRRPAWNSSTNLDSKRRAPNTPAQPVKIAVPLLPASTNQERVNPVRASQPSTQHVPTIHPISSSPSPAYALNSGSPMPALTIGPLTPLPSIPHLLRTLEPNSQSKFAIYEPLYEYAKEAPSDAEVARMKNQLCKGRPSDCKCGTGICVSDVLEMVKANPKINNFGSNLLDDIMTITFQSRSLRASAISACLQD